MLRNPESLGFVQAELANNRDLARAGCRLWQGFAAGEQLPDGVSFAADHALAELLQNIADHSTATRVTLFFETDSLAVRVTVMDDGDAFDPTQTPAPDFTIPFDERRVGGLGVHMIRQLADDVTYARRPGGNELVWSKRLPGA